MPRALNAPVSPSEPAARPDTPPPWSPAALRPLVGRVVASCALGLVRLADRIDPQEPPTARNRAVEESKARHPAFGGPAPAARAGSVVAGSIVYRCPEHGYVGTSPCVRPHEPRVVYLPRRGYGASEGDLL